MLEENGFFNRQPLLERFENLGALGYEKEDFANPENIKALLNIYQICTDPNTLQAALNGEITLASIKPRLDEAIKDNQKVQLAATNFNQDSSLELALEQEIAQQFIINNKFSLVLDHHVLNRFYNAQGQMRKKPMNSTRYGVNHETRWAELAYLMTHYPTTYLLLSHPQGDVCSRWRKTIGSSYKFRKLRKAINQNSLRRKLMIDEHNSIFHGSSSAEEVIRELLVLAEFVYCTALVVSRSEFNPSLAEQFYQIKNELGI